MDKIFVMNEHGIPIVMLDFGQNRLVLDQNLLAGFLSALGSFSNELFQNQSNKFMIDNGTYVISLFKQSDIVLAVFANQSVLQLETDFKKLMTFFHDTYDFEDGELHDISKFEDFRRKSIRILFKAPIAEDWIPVFNKDHKDYHDYATNYPIIEEFATGKMISEHPKFSAENKEWIYEVLNFAKFLKLVDFSNVIEPRDYIKANETLLKILHDEDSYRILKNKYSTINLIDFVQDLQFFSRIHDLQQQYGEQILNTIKSMYDLGYIQLIDESVRQILISVDLANDFLKILQSVIKPNKIKERLEKLIKILDQPEIYTRLLMEQNPIHIDKQNLVETLDEEKTERRTQLWVNFVVNLVEIFYRDYRKKLNEIFYEKLTNHYLEYIHAQDFHLMDEVMLKIENACL